MFRTWTALVVLSAPSLNNNNNHQLRRPLVRDEDPKCEKCLKEMAKVKRNLEKLRKEMYADCDNVPYDFARKECKLAADAMIDQLKNTPARELCQHAGFCA